MPEPKHISMRWVADRRFRTETATDRHWDEIVALLRQGTSSTDTLDVMRNRYPDDTFSRDTLYDRAKIHGVAIVRKDHLNARKPIDPPDGSLNPTFEIAFSKPWI